MLTWVRSKARRWTRPRLEAPEERRAVDLVGFLEQYGDLFVGNLECETLGRLSMASKRCLALNRTGKLARRWEDAAAMLDRIFPMADPVENYDVESFWDRFTGKDPRMADVIIDDEGRLSLPDDYVLADYDRCMMAVRERLTAAWRATPAMIRVKTVIEWQSAVARACRALPEDYYGINKFVLNRRDSRFAGDYDFDGYPSDETFWDLARFQTIQRCSPGMKLIVRLTYLNCCDIDRCTEQGYDHASDVFLEGWGEVEDCVPWTDRWLFNDVLTGEFFEKIPNDSDSDSDDDERAERRARHRAHAISKHKAWFLAGDHSLISDRLAPLIGDRICSQHLSILRGPDVDLPANWEDLFGFDPDFDDDDDDEEVGSEDSEIVFLECLQWELWRQKQRGLSNEDAKVLVHVLHAKLDDDPDFFNAIFVGGMHPFEFLESKVGRDALPASIFEHIDAPDNLAAPIVITLPNGSTMTVGLPPHHPHEEGQQQEG